MNVPTQTETINNSSVLSINALTSADFLGQEFQYQLIVSDILLVTILRSTTIQSTVTNQQPILAFDVVHLGRVRGNLRATPELERGR